MSIPAFGESVFLPWVSPISLGGRFVSSEQPEKNIAVTRISHKHAFMPDIESTEHTIPQLQSGKHLILLRHAKSSWADPSLEDFQRLLNKRGLRDAPDMGKRLAAKYPTPGHFASSPAARAWATSEIVAHEWGFPQEELVAVDEAYEAFTSALIDIVRQFPSTASLAVLAGHNPSITSTINSLADMDIMNVPTCGVGVLRFAVESWTEVGESGAELIDYDFPKNRPGHGT